MQAFDAGVVPTRSRSRASTWLLWTDYCTQHHLDPFLTNVADTLPILQVFAQRYRTGALAPHRQPVKSRTVEAALRAVGQTFASVGADDPRYDKHGNVHFVLQQMLKGFTRDDPSVTRVKPLPFAVINHAVTTAITPLDKATADLAVVGFFFLLRPGEHTSSAPTSDSHPFRLCDVVFRVGTTSVPAATGDPALIQIATFVALTFTKQKNGTENEIVGHARSGHATTCPVLALIRRCLHLRSNPTLPTTPLCTVYQTPITATPITPFLLTTFPRWGSILQTYQLAPYGRAVLWLFSTRRSIPMLSNSLAVGDPMKCCVISIYKPIPRCALTHRAWRGVVHHHHNRLVPFRPRP